MGSTSYSFVEQPIMKQPSILVVDDEPDNFDVIEAFLGQCGYQLHYASNGLDAIESLAIFKPDVILLDVMMPGLNGIEVCVRIKSLPLWQTVPIVIVTALVEKKELARCLAAGADDFISKPLNSIELRSRVHSMLRIKQNYIDLEQQVQERTEALQAKANRERLLSTIATQIRSSLDLEEILETTVREVRELLDCDQVLVWQLQPDFSALMVADSANDRGESGFPKNHDPDLGLCLDDQSINAYRLGQACIITDTSQEVTDPDSAISINPASVRAQMVVPIIYQDTLWGLLNATECQRSRNWEPSDVDLLRQLATHLAIALQQATAYQQLQNELNERRQAEARLRESEQRYVTLANAVPVGIFRADMAGNYIYVNQHWCTISQIQDNDAYGLGWINSLHPDDASKVIEEWNQATLTNRKFQLEYRLQRNDRDVVWVFAQAVAEYNANRELTGYVGTITDISNLKRAEALILHNALHDPLTGLPNRMLLSERIELAINRSKRVDTYQYAVLFLDLDQFKVINDSLSHLIGDRVLIQIAQNLKSHFRSIDFLARIGGDEFVLLLEEIDGFNPVFQIIDKILNSFQKPIVIDSYEIVITASIGVVIGNKNYDSASALLRDADIAMYRAKASGRSTYKIFGVEMHHQAVNRLTLETDLRKALAQQEFKVSYQPIIDLDQNRLVGFEALARWYHPTKGWISPSEFIPIAEEIGIIQRLSQWILRQACQQLVTWQRQFPHRCPLKMSVNLSAQELRDANLVNEIGKVLAETGLDPQYLTIEITESMLIEDINQTILLLTQLKENQIQISIDDFGTGYSSLSYLHRLPADNLKIDRSFVGQMEQDNRNFQVVSTIITLSNQLGLAVIAEGVETHQQLQWLKSLGCEFGQGYLFSRPLMPNDVEIQVLSEVSCLIG